MHFEPSQPTMPVTGSFSSAWNGQPEAQAGSAQCMHWRLTNECSSLSGDWYSLMMFFVWHERSVGIRCSPPDWPVSGSSPFACWQWMTQALQPMQRVAS